jgi:hypothetical protein
VEPRKELTTAKKYQPISSELGIAPIPQLEFESAIIARTAIIPGFKTDHFPAINNDPSRPSAALRPNIFRLLLICFLHSTSVECFFWD